MREWWGEQFRSPLIRFMTVSDAGLFLLVSRWRLVLFVLLHPLLMLGHYVCHFGLLR